MAYPRWRARLLHRHHLADYLVRKGVGKAVRYGVGESGTDLSDMTLAELHPFFSDIEEDLFEVMALEGPWRRGTTWEKRRLSG